MFPLLHLQHWFLVNAPSSCCGEEGGASSSLGSPQFGFHPHLKHLLLLLVTPPAGWRRLVQSEDLTRHQADSQMINPPSEVHHHACWVTQPPSSSSPPAPGKVGASAVEPLFSSSSFFWAPPQHQEPSWFLSLSGWFLTSFFFSSAGVQQTGGDNVTPLSSPLPDRPFRPDPCSQSAHTCSCSGSCQAETVLTFSSSSSSDTQHQET